MKLYFIYERPGTVSFIVWAMTTQILSSAANKGHMHSSPRPERENNYLGTGHYLRKGGGGKNRGYMYK
jgi:hypothetical protein